MIIFPLLKGVVLKKDKNRIFTLVDFQGKIFTYIKKDKFSFLNIPFLRGIWLLFFGVFYFFNSLYSSMLKEKNNKKNSYFISKKFKKLKKIIFIFLISLLSFLIGFVFFTILPNYIFVYIIGKGFNKYLISIFIGLYRIILCFSVLYIIKFIPIVNQLYRYNSSINNFTYKIDGKKYINFLNYTIICLIVCLFVLSFVVFEINFFLKILINCIIVISVFSLACEIFYIFNNCKIFRIITAFVTNVKTTKTEMFIIQILLYEGGFSNDKMINIEKINQEDIQMSLVYNEVKEKLSLAGINDIAETEWLIASILNKNRTAIKLLKSISKTEYKKIQQATEKRIKHIPLSKIIGTQEFFGRDFIVNENVLSPRQDTELVVEEAIKIIKDVDIKSVLDLCTGSGAIAITINKETGIKTFASDISDLALKVAVENSNKLQADVKFIKSDLFSKINKKFDLIISNPPYIPTEEVEKLDPEVKDNDPLISLDGGEDGLYFYKEIIRQAPKYLNKNGYIVFEIGYNQGANIKKLLQNDFENIRIKKDYSKNDRIAIAKLKGK